MSSLSDHPTVKRFWERAKATPVKPDSVILDAKWLRQLCLDAGADDVGFVDIDRPELGTERADIVPFFQPTKALISFILRMNREPIRSPARSAANVEFHQTGEQVNEVGEESCLGPGAEEDSPERITAIVAGLWQVLPFMN